MPKILYFVKSDYNNAYYGKIKKSFFQISGNFKIGGRALGRKIETVNDCPFSITRHYAQIIILDYQKVSREYVFSKPFVFNASTK